MIKRIIQMADVHIRNLQREDEYEEGLSNIITKCKEQCEGLAPEECRIVICGDLVHQKNTITNELLIRTSSFLRELEKICKVYVIAGNHDFVETNSSRMDTLSALFATMELQNTVFLDGYFHNSYGDDTMQEGDVTTPFSGILVDQNINWALFSIMGEGKYKYENPFDSTRIPTKRKPKGNLTVGLFHGKVDGCTMYNGANTDSPVKGDIFKKCNCVMAGDIHKRQTIYFGETYFVYSGSPIQQDMGESVLEHGISVWDIDENNEFTQKFVDIDSTFGYYKIVVNNISDLDEDKEFIANYD